MTNYILHILYNKYIMLINNMKLQNIISNSEKLNNLNNYFYLFLFSCLISSCALIKGTGNNIGINVDNRWCDMFLWKLDTTDNTEEEKEIISNWIWLFTKLTGLNLYTEKIKDRVIKILFLGRDEVAKIFVQELEDKILEDYIIAKDIYDSWRVSKEDFEEWVRKSKYVLHMAKNRLLTWWVNWYSWKWNKIYISNDASIGYPMWYDFNQFKLKTLVTTHEITHRFWISHNDNPYNEPQNLMNDWWPWDLDEEVILNQYQLNQIQMYYKQCLIKFEINQ